MRAHLGPCTDKHNRHQQNVHRAYSPGHFDRGVRSCKYRDGRDNRPNTDERSLWAKSRTTLASSTDILHLFGHVTEVPGETTELRRSRGSDKPENVREYWKPDELNLGHGEYAKNHNGHGQATDSIHLPTRPVLIGLPSFKLSRRCELARERGLEALRDAEELEQKHGFIVIGKGH